jgi:hypothetical protein
MMKSDVTKAIDDATAEGIKRLFGILALAIETGEPNLKTASERFQKGLADHITANAAASDVIITIMKN